MTSDQIEIEKLKIERERLSLEKQQGILKFLSVVGACATFAWSAFGYFDARKREAENRKIEAAKVFLDRQLLLLEEATSLTGRIAAAGVLNADPKDIDRFWQLYWGELGLVEGGTVAGAMANFGRKLDASRASELGPAALSLAHAARDELSESWKVDVLRQEKPR